MGEAARRKKLGTYPEQVLPFATRAQLTLRPDPFEGDTFSPDAARLWLADTNRETFHAFHVTTPDDATRILGGDIEEREPCRVGFDGRMQPRGFWVNNVPWIPYSIEQWHPMYTYRTDMAVIRLVLPIELVNRFHIEHTWPFLQWPVPFDVARAAPAYVVPPQEFARWRDAGWMRTLREFVLEEEELLTEGYAVRAVQ